MTEHEVKLLVDPGTVLPSDERLLQGHASWTTRDLELTATYFDTPDLRLTRSGVSLRNRSDDGWTVKVPVSRRGATFVRGEFSFASGDANPPPEAVDFVRGWTRAADLEPVATLTTRRRETTVFDALGQEACVVADDHVVGEPAGADVVRFHEIEVEARTGNVAVVSQLEERLRRAGAGSGPSTQKINRVLGHRGEVAPDLAFRPRLGRRATVADLITNAILVPVASLVDNDHRVRLGDPEGVHAARVATRRLRSHLRTYRPVLDRAWVESLRQELRWFGELLGHVRDADVMIQRLENRIADLAAQDRGPAGQLVASREVTRDQDRTTLSDGMRSERYTALLNVLVDATRAPHLRDARVGTERWRAVQHLVDRPWKRTRRTVHRLPKTPTNEELHEVRKRAKHARYALESIEPRLGKDVRRSIKLLTDLQDRLGEQHDATVVIDWLRHASADAADPRIAFAAGQIARSFSLDERAHRRRWRKTWRAVKQSI